MKHATARGVAIETAERTNSDGTPFRFQYLLRKDGGEIRTYPMPYAFAEDRPLGFGRMVDICGRLRIPEPKDWPVEF